MRTDRAVAADDRGRGIGLCNFAEGLAIGNSAVTGELSLAVLLATGLGLRNTAEGIGIVAPLLRGGLRQFLLGAVAVAHGTGHLLRASMGCRWCGTGLPTLLRCSHAADVRGRVWVDDREADEIRHGDELREVAAGRWARGQG
ncbi:hypothetical protein [Amycolatopsis sp. GA6-003]|uniref:hypothetical protein n=1 Tax=Amycolatopsis sp. GA6-003 TaxID=2652444 RepID=UPI00391703C4